MPLIFHTLAAKPAHERQASPQAGNVASGLGGELEDAAEGVSSAERSLDFGGPVLPDVNAIKDAINEMVKEKEVPANKFQRGSFKKSLRA